jgi:phosphotransacetylase
VSEPVRVARPPQERPWTPADTAWLLRLYRKGLTLRQIAEAMDRSHATVAAAIVRLGDADWIGPEDYGSARRKREESM